MNPDLVTAVMEDWQTAPVAPRLRAGLDVAEAITRRPAEIDQTDVARWRAAGLDEVAIEDAANVAFHFNFINRLADAFDFPIPDARQLPRLARFLDRTGNIFLGRRPKTSHAVGSDGRVRPVEVEHGRSRMLEAPGVTSPALRAACEAYTARLRGGTRPALELPEAIGPYLEKLALHAYRIVDTDIELLREQGHEDEAIFEITLTAAMGASIVGLERVFELIRGAAILPAAGPDRATVSLDPLRVPEAS